MPYRRRGRRFGTNKGAVLQSSLTAKRKAKCRGCHQTFEAGDAVVRLRLRKNFRKPCVTCNHKLLGVRWYHPQCVPVDINKAMGYDPYATHTATHTAPPVAPPSSTVAAPPPKPQTAQDAQLAALLAIENALKRRLAENPALKKNAELDAALKTYNGCKARALRPSTPAEGIVALKMALKRALDIVF